jgi:O-antigen/teichoic acid export membrane protein
MSSADDRAVSSAPAPDRTPLWNAFARGVRDNLVAEVMVQGLRVGGMVLLARELTPANFGLLKVLLIVSMFATLFSESGIPDALIQRKDLTPEHEATAWWLSLGLVSATIATLYVAAPLIAALMAMKGLCFAIRLICLPMFLEGTAIVSVARLSRALRFGALATADVLAEIAFLTAAFTLLWRGRPEWSLAGGLAARFAAHACVVWLMDHRMPLRMPRATAARDLGRFAASVLGGRVVTTASSNADFILVGRLLGSSALGYYGMAWDLLRFVPDRLHRVAGRVALPTFCRLQDYDDELGRAYCSLVNYISRALLPIAGCVALAAPQLITGIYGPQWLPAALPMRLLAFGLALVGLRIGMGAMYYAKSYPSIDIYLNGARLILVVAAVVTTARVGLLGVSASVSTAEVVISVAGQYLVCVLAHLRVREVAASILPGLRVACACFIAAALGKTLAALGGVQGSLTLLFIALPPALVFFWLEGGEISHMAAGAFKPVALQAPQVQLD